MPAQANSPTGSVRARPRALWTAAAILVVLRIALGVYESRHPPKYTDKVHWVAAAEAAKNAGLAKPILYVFSASWCGPCKLMQMEVFGEQSIADRINQDFTPVHVLEGGEPGLTTAFEASALQEKYGVGGYPTLVVVGADRSPSTLNGYPGKDAARSFLLGGWQSNQAPENLRDFKTVLKKQMEAVADGGQIDGGRFPGSARIWWEPSDQESLAQAIARAEKEVQASGGAVIVGKIEAPGGGDARATWAQVQILPGGNFAAAVRPDAKILQFRQDGYAPVDLRLDPSALKGTVHVPPIRLRELPSQELTRVHGHVVAPHIDALKVDHYPVILSVSPGGGTQGIPHSREQRSKMTVQPDGTLLGSGFSPGRHFFWFAEEDAVTQSRTADLKAGEDFDLGTLILEPVKSFTLRYYASDSSDFSKATASTKTLHGDQGFRASDRTPTYAHSVFFEQKDGAVRITSKYGPWKAYDLGPGKIEDFRKNVPASGQPISTSTGQKLEPGHVYLSENSYFKEWVLFEASSAPSIR